MQRFGEETEQKREERVAEFIAEVQRLWPGAELIHVNDGPNQEHQLVAPP
jgi:hypothetical protein